MLEIIKVWFDNIGDEQRKFVASKTLHMLPIDRDRNIMPSVDEFVQLLDRYIEDRSPRKKGMALALISTIDYILYKNDDTDFYLDKMIEEDEFIEELRAAGVPESGLENVYKGDFIAFQKHAKESWDMIRNQYLNVEKFHCS